MHNFIYRDKNYVEINKLVTLALFMSIAIMLSVLENFIPINFVVPGIKLGLSNIVLLLILPYYSLRSLMFYQFTRITITSFILGIFSTYIFSIIAGFIALFAMYFLYKLFEESISIYTLSIVGAVTHNITQIILASVSLKSTILLLYIYPLIIAGVIMGFLVALIVDKKLYLVRRKLQDDEVKQFFS